MIPFFTKMLESTATKIPFTLKLLNPYYNQMVDDEINIAKIKDTDNVLVIGGGPVPMTAMMIHQRTQARLTIIDHDKNVIPKASKCLKHYCSHGEISLMHGCVKSIDLSPYTVIHIAKQVSPKACVLNHILTHAPKTTRVLVRLDKTDKALKQDTSYKHHKRLVKETCLFTV